MKIGHKILYHANVSSTNEAAMEIINTGKAVDGTVISAGFQSLGKGQRNNRWHSDPFMNLIMSVILKPSGILPEQQFYISKIVSIALLETISDYSDQFSIKWPNDIYHKCDKIAGILIEHTITGNTISASVAGIGLNINQDKFPPEIPNPISLFEITGVTHNVQHLEDKLCQQLDKWYSRLKRKEFELIDRKYEENLYRNGLESEFETINGPVRGKINGVNVMGQLLVKSIDGSEKTYSFKEIEFLSH